MDRNGTEKAVVLRGTVFKPALFCAPMAGITHSAFRRLVADYGGYGALFTEMLSAKMILQEDLMRSPWVKRRPEEGRVIYQLLVTDTVRLAESIDRLAVVAPDGLDLNVACDAPNVRQMRGGSSLFEDGERLAGILRVMRRQYAGPLTVKLRLGSQEPGWEAKLGERVRLLEAEGVDGLTVHARFREDKFKRRVRYEVYGELAARTRLPIVANGDIAGVEFCREHGDVVEKTAGLMIGRMAAARPWLFAQWHNAALVVNHREVWNRLCEYILEDFPAHKALMRMKILAPYFARNFFYGHGFFTAQQSAPDVKTARARADAFLAASPELCGSISMQGI